MPPQDERKDSDFIRLSDQVKEGFEENSKEHREIMEALSVHDRRFEQQERAIVALEKGFAAVSESNVHIKRLLLGSPDGKIIGCQERQRNQEAFARTIKRLAWLVATPIVTLSVGGIILIVKYILQN